MKLQGRNIAIQLSGDNVKLPHTELTRLGFTIPDAESRDSLFGSGTEDIVKRFQTSQGTPRSAMIPYAEKFISHYDEWLQTYRDNRKLQNKTEAKQVFTYSFPHDAEKAFIEKFDVYRKEPEIEGSLN